jgi:2-aminoethylphosphonate--pyruvate transaminase
MYRSSQWRDSLLFTPGPLSTSPTVKQAMLRDLGARDEEFLGVVCDVKKRLLKLAEVPPESYEAILMQGCGSMGVEATLGTAVPREGKLLVVANGAYGRRMAEMARAMGMQSDVVTFSERNVADAKEVDRRLAGDPAITHVAVVHCETTSGLFNPIDHIGAVVHRHKRSFIVDAMSSFGAAYIRMLDWHIDWLISSANKCIEGVPGFSFVIARREKLAECNGNSRSLSLDLYAQHEDMRRNGQFRFTPPTQAILAFRQALFEHEMEGGYLGRMQRYQGNNEVLRREMRTLGFTEYLAEQDQGWIITSYLYPDHPAFDFAGFYSLLRNDGFVIYPGKVGDAEVFRVGNIGHIDLTDIYSLVAAVRRALAALDVELNPVEQLAMHGE